MLDSQHRSAAHYAKAARLNQRVNQALSRENASATSFMESVRSQAAEQRSSLALTAPAKIASVTTVWMSFTFLLCYLALPMARMGLGLSTQTAAGLMTNVLASAAGLMAVFAMFAVGIAALRPSVSVNVDPDKTLAATAGSLLVWGFLHNILPGLIPFGEMGAGELLTFTGSNILESALFGVMLASFASTGRRAFTLGAAFQGVFLVLSYLAMFALVL